MVSTIDIIQLSYFVPSLVLLIIFVIRLTNEILIKKNPTYNNNFFPLILFKSYSDIILLLTIFICGRVARMNILENFYEDKDGIAAYYYVINALCNTVTYGISLLSSFNTFIALNYPLLYDTWFSKKNILIYLVIIFLVGSIYGIGFIFFYPHYLYVESLEGYYIKFKSLYIPYYILAYSVIVVYPIAILVIIMNTISTVKFTKYYKKINAKNSQNVLMFIYTLVIFFTYLIVVAYTVTKILTKIFIQNDLIEHVADIVIYWNIDIQTFGLFYTVLFLYSPLRDLMLFKSKKECNQNNNITIINHNERPRIRQNKPLNIN
uniref:Serpentine receptor class gamma n=1 Tax=Strongyloides venezuelensis TaxID=75913 RepID=A0A0K0F468_STRVS